MRIHKAGDRELAFCVDHLNVFPTWIFEARDAAVFDPDIAQLSAIVAQDFRAANGAAHQNERSARAGRKARLRSSAAEGLRSRPKARATSSTWRSRRLASALPRPLARAPGVAMNSVSAFSFCSSPGSLMVGSRARTAAMPSSGLAR